MSRLPMKKFVLLTLLTLVVLLLIAAVVLLEGDFPTAEVDARYSNDQSRFMTAADGARVHYRDQGNPAGPPVVLVHGSNASLHTWEPWVERLGEQYRLITMDLPGHGLTGAVPSAAYDSAAQIATVKALVDQLGVSRFVLGGNSMGGGVSWRYALEYPQSVSALILVDSSGLWGWRDDPGAATADDAEGQDAGEDEDKGPLAFRLLREPWFRGIAGSLDTRILVEQGLKASFDDTSKVTNEMIELYYNMSMRSGTREATLARFGSFGSRGDDVTEADMATLSMPTLILWGETDALIPVETGARFDSVLPNSQLIVYPDVGHIPMEEVADQSANDVLEFLAQRNPA